MPEALPAPLYPGGPTWKAAARFLIGHHPLCSVYATDIGTVGKGRFPICRGCAIVFPAGLIGGPLAALALSHARPDLASAVATAGFLLGGVQLGAYMLPGLGRGLRLAVKVALGVACLLFVGGILALEAPWPMKVALMAGAYVLLGLTQGLRLVRMRRKCGRCIWRADWKRCPGFAPFNDFRPDAVPRPELSVPRPEFR